MIKISINENRISEKNTDEQQLYVVRLYDGFDHEWFDVCKPTTKEEAEKIWNEKTNGGTERTSFDDIDYYRVFEADTRMLINQREYENDYL